MREAKLPKAAESFLHKSFGHPAGPETGQTPVLVRDVFLGQKPGKKETRKNDQKYFLRIYEAST